LAPVTASATLVHAAGGSTITIARRSTAYETVSSSTEASISPLDV
jgi:hypothetical protein